MKSKILILVIIGLLAGCGKNDTKNNNVKKSISLVEVAQAQRRDLTKTITFTGSVEPVKIARIASPAEGPVVKCSVREGDIVQEGQQLVQIGRSRIASSALIAAEEELNRQGAEFRRIDQLVKSGALPGDQLDATRANLKKAEAQVAAMETGANDYEIKAPWEGVISKVWISEGNYVAPRTPLVELYDPKSFVVRFFVPEQQALVVSKGQSVEVVLDAHHSRLFTGRIVRVYPELERISRTLTVEAVLEDNIRLLGGMFARVDVAVKTLPGVIVIPVTALVVLPNGETVVFVVEQEKASLRKVQTTMEVDGFVAVSSGIKDGELVVTRGNEALKDGATVKIMGEKKKSGDISTAPTSSKNGESAE